MEKQDLQELALRLSAFVEMLEKQATSVADNMAQSGQTMTRSARDIAGQEISKIVIINPIPFAYRIRTGRLQWE